MFAFVFSNSDGMTPVMTAASGNNCEALRMLIEAGGDVNHADCDGKTAQDYIRESQCKKCLQLTSCVSGLMPGVGNPHFYLICGMVGINGLC